MATVRRSMRTGAGRATAMLVGIGSAGALPSSAAFAQSYAAGNYGPTCASDCISIGAGASATGPYSIAFGSTPTAVGEKSISIGFLTRANSIGEVNIGATTGTTTYNSDYSTAIGAYAGDFNDGTPQVAGDAQGRNTSIGYGTGQFVLGAGNSVLGTSSGQAVTGDNNLAAGRRAGSFVTGNNNVSVGYTSGTISPTSMSGVTGDNNVAVGTGAGGNIVGSSNISLGQNAGQYVTGNGNVFQGIGAGSGTATVQNTINNAVAIGTQAVVRSDGAVAIGASATAQNGKAVSIGNGNTASGDGSVAIGDPNSAGTASVALGRDNTANGSNGLAGAVALGDANVANGTGAVALGSRTAASGTAALALGVGSSAGADGAMAFGNTAVANTANGLAFGTNATATNAGDVALGSGSVTSATTPVSGITIGGNTLSFAGAVPTAAMSVGGRQVQNVAAGRISAASTDAVNGSQLYSVAQGSLNAVLYDVDADGNRLNSVTLAGGNAGQPVALRNVAPGSLGANSTDAVNGSQINTLASSIAGDLGGGATYNTATGAVTAPVYTVQGRDFSNVGDTIAAVNKLSVQYTADANGNPTNQVTLVGAGNGNPVTLSNVAAGRSATDAVNVAQLKQAEAGSVRYDSYSTGGVNYNSLTFNRGGTPTILHNVGAGTVATDGVNLGQVIALSTSDRSYTDTQVGNLASTLNNRLAGMEGEISRDRRTAAAGAAAGMAAAALRYDERPGRGSLAMGVGGWKGETAISAGVGYTIDSADLRLNGAATFVPATNDVGWNAGLSWTFW